MLQQPRFPDTLRFPDTGATSPHAAGSNGGGGETSMRVIVTVPVPSAGEIVQVRLVRSGQRTAA